MITPFITVSVALSGVFVNGNELIVNANIFNNVYIGLLFGKINTLSTLNNNTIDRFYVNINSLSLESIGTITIGMLCEVDNIFINNSFILINNIITNIEDAYFGGFVGFGHFDCYIINSWIQIVISENLKPEYVVFNCIIYLLFDNRYLYLNSITDYFNIFTSGTVNKKILEIQILLYMTLIRIQTAITIPQEY